jgi:hypothetical protein
MSPIQRLRSLSFALGVAAFAACAPSTPPASAPAPQPDSRVGLKGGRFDAEQATWNLKVVANTAPPEQFINATHSDLAFLGNYAIQGNYNGILVWDISNPSRPVLKSHYYCPASQNDVSVYRNLLFVSAEAYNGRLDCGGEGIRDSVSAQRIRGIRIFEPEVHPQRADVPRLAHAHRVPGSGRQRERVRVHLRVGAGAFAQRDAGLS